MAPSEDACARSRHRRHRPFPDRPRRQGLARRRAPGRPRRRDRPGRARQGAPPRPARDRRPAPRAAACPAASRASTWPASSPSASATTTCPARPSPGTARPRCRPPGWRCTRSRPARATCSSRPASRPCPGSSGQLRLAGRTPTTRSSPTAEARDRSQAAQAVARPGTTRATTATCRTSTSPMGQTAENLAQVKGVTREDMDQFGVRSQNLAEKAIADGFWAREITPVTLPTAPWSRADDGPRPGVTYEAVSQLKPVFRPDGRVTAGNCCPLNDGAAAVVDHERPARPPNSASPRWPASSPPAVSALSPEIMGLGPVEASRQALARAGHDHRRRRPGRDQRGVRGPGHPVLPRAGHRPRQAQRQRRGDRGRATRSA